MLKLFWESFNSWSALLTILFSLVPKPIGTSTFEIVLILRSGCIPARLHALMRTMWLLRTMSRHAPRNRKSMTWPFKVNSLAVHRGAMVCSPNRAYVIRAICKNAFLQRKGSGLRCDENARQRKRSKGKNNEIMQHHPRKQKKSEAIQGKMRLNLCQRRISRNCATKCDSTQLRLRRWYGSKYNAVQCTILQYKATKWDLIRVEERQSYRIYINVTRRMKNKKGQKTRKKKEKAMSYKT